jgi:hypothetical protein
MRWCVRVLQMSDGWAGMLESHLNVIKLQNMSFGSSDTLFLKTVRLEDDTKNLFWSHYRFVTIRKKWGCRSLSMGGASAAASG